jgi:hypothetical protein
MTLREEVINKLQHANDLVLERVKKTLEQAELEARYAELPDIRVQRTQAEKDEFKRLLQELAEPVPGEDLSDFNAAVKRRPLRTTPVEFEP